MSNQIDNQSTSKKIDAIRGAYINNNAQIWNLDTDIYKSWERFFLNVSIFHSTNTNITKGVIKRTENYEGKERFHFLINDIEVEPNSRKKENGWARSSMRQFLQVGEAFGFFIIDISKINKINNSDSLDCKFTIEFNEILSPQFMNNFHYFLLKSMQKGLISDIEYVKNLGLSLFEVTMNTMKKNFIYEDYTKPVTISKIKNKSIKNEKKGRCMTTGTEDYEKYIKKIYNETFRSCVDLFIEKFECQKFLDSLLSTLKDEKCLDLIMTKEEYSKEDFVSKYINFTQKIDSARAKLRTNIINNRCKDKEKYNDLLNTHPDLWYIQDCEAAHIFDVWKIKMVVKEMIHKNIDEKEIEKFVQVTTTSADNGILLLNQWHVFFDKGLISFNSNGEILIFSDGDKQIMDRLKPINSGLDLNEIKINPEILNQKMKEFLKMRTTIVSK